MSKYHYTYSNKYIYIGENATMETVSNFRAIVVFGMTGSKSRIQKAFSHFQGSWCWNNSSGTKRAAQCIQRITQIMHKSNEKKKVSDISEKYP